MEDIKVKNKNLALGILVGAQFLVALDATIVNIALPAISRALHFSNAASLQWIITIYTITFGGFLLLGGRLADLYGRRRVFSVGVLLFTLMSLAAGLSQNSTQIIIFRAIQGISAALLSPAALSLILSIFKEGKERNSALGVWAGVAAGGGAVGLLLGGVLTQYVSWRFIFLVNVPVGLLIYALTQGYVPKVVETIKNKGLDILGGVLVTSGLMTLVYAFIKSTAYGWASGKTLSLIGLAIALLAAFVVNEAHVKKPLIDLSIFKRRNVTFSNIVQLPAIGAMYGTFFFLSIYLQEILHYSPAKSGLATFPLAIFLAVGAGITSKLLTKIQPRVTLSISPLLMAAGLVFLSHIPVAGNYWTHVFPGIAILATGIGSTLVAVTLAATSGVPRKQSGLASGLLNTSQQIGIALGLAILTVLSTSRTKSIIVSTHAHTTAALASAAVAGFQHAFIIAAIFTVGAAAVAFIGIPNLTLDPSKEQENLNTELEDITPAL